MTDMCWSTYERYIICLHYMHYMRNIVSEAAHAHSALTQAEHEAKQIDFPKISGTKISEILTADRTYMISKYTHSK